MAQNQNQDQETMDTELPEEGQKGGQSTREGDQSMEETSSEFDTEDKALE